MRKCKIRVALLGLVLMAGILAGCGSEQSTSAGPKEGAANERSARLTEQYQDRLETAVPYPLDAMKDSIERRNLRERLLRFNQANKIGYVYFLGDTGSVIAFYTIKGKVSSTESQMTASEIERVHGYQGGQSGNSIESPSDDGSYGPNEDGIFFFTTEDVLVQWNGKFLYADAPLKVTTPPLVTIDAGSKPSSTSETPPK